VNQRPELELRWSWLPAPELRAPELAATFAGLEIRIGGSTVTLVEDTESGSARRQVFVPLYPLAEWMAFNWWLLLANTRPATALGRLESRDDLARDRILRRYQGRHGVRGAGDGFHWPDLLILPEGDTTRLVWQADRGVGEQLPVRYLASGEASVDGTSLRTRMTNLIEDVLARLDDRGVGDTPLAQEWVAIRSADKEEASYCHAAASLGLDPYAEAEPYEAGILEAHHALRGTPELLDDFLAAVDPRQLGESLAWVRRAEEEIEALTARATAGLSRLWSQVDLSLVHGDLAPWEIGWRYARHVRSVLGLGADQRLVVDDLVTELVRPGGARGIRAAGGVHDPTGGPIVVVPTRQTPPVRSFLLARALWHIVQRRRWGFLRFLVTSAHTSRQRVERAFAAELLAPAEGIRHRLDGDMIAGLEDDVLVDVADGYGVSPLVVRHQIENQ
jgi:hypothetical protein